VGAGIAAGDGRSILSRGDDTAGCTRVPRGFLRSFRWDSRRSRRVTGW